mgnify:CR=1 FL=1
MLNVTNSNLVAGAIWAILDSLVIIGGGFAYLNKISKRLDKIEYALFNDGKTGLINKVDCLMENQQEIKTDIAVVKAKYDN